MLYMLLGYEGQMPLHSQFKELPPFIHLLPTSIVCAWCIALMAVCAMALVVKVTNAQPGKRRVKNSLIHSFIYLETVPEQLPCAKYHASNTDNVPAFGGL